MLLGMTEDLGFASAGPRRAVLVSNPVLARLMVARQRRRVRRMPGLPPAEREALLNAMRKYKPAKGTTRNGGRGLTAGGANMGGPHPGGRDGPRPAALGTGESAPTRVGASRPAASCRRRSCWSAEPLGPNAQRASGACVRSLSLVVSYSGRRRRATISRSAISSGHGRPSTGQFSSSGSAIQVGNRRRSSSMHIEQMASAWKATASPSAPHQAFSTPPSHAGSLQQTP